MGHCIRNILMFVFTSLLRHQLVVKKTTLSGNTKIHTETTKAPKNISMDFLAPKGVPSYILKIPPRNTLYKMYEPHFIVLYCAQRTQLSLKMNQ